MPEIRNDSNIVIFSEVGGSIERWQYRGIDIFYPQQLVRREQKMKLRGGMHICWPFGTVDPQYGLLKHGVLRDRVADEVLRNGAVFRGTDLLGPAYHEAAEIQVTIDLLHTGFRYVVSARLLEPPSRDVFINPGLHPYFRTPTGNAQVSAWGGQVNHFYCRKHGPVGSTVGKGMDTIIPGVGKIQMLIGGAWHFTSSKRVYFWRDSRNYLCVEPVFGSPDTYGKPHCLRLTDKPFEMICTFHVAPSD